MDIFKENSIKSAVREIQQLVEQNGCYAILYPAYIPDLGIGKEYSVVGKAQCQTRIANSLKDLGIESKKLAPSYYVFFLKNLSEEAKEEAERDARRIAIWYDLIE